MPFGPDQAFTILLAVAAVICWGLLKRADRKASK